MENPNNPPYELYANKRQAFANQYSKPLEILVSGIHLGGFITKTSLETGLYYKSNFIESVDDSEKRGAGIYAKTPYADVILGLVNRYDEAFHFLENLKGTIVLDLASGDGIGEKMYGYVLAQLLGAKSYIGVDKFHKPLIEYFSIQEIKGRFDIYSKNIPFAMVTEDALDFLHRMPDNSVSILTSALTRQISIHGQYVISIEKEITRVLDPNGAYVSFFSDFEPNGLVRSKFDETKFNMLGGLLKFIKMEVNKNGRK